MTAAILLALLAVLGDPPAPAGDRTGILAEVQFEGQGEAPAFEDRTAAALWLDYDGDGREDLLVVRFGRSQLFRNLGPGPDGVTFTEVTEQAGLDSYRNAITAVAFDYDGDGDLDLVLGNYFQPVNLFDPETPHFFMGNYNDVLMEQLADRGNGRHAYVDTLAEPQRLFVEELTGTLYSIAAEAPAQVELDPEMVSRYRLLGYENRDIADERFRDDRVNAAEIGSGHTATAPYEIKLREGVDPRREERPMGILRVRYRPIESERFEEKDLLLEAGMLAPSWEAASGAVRLAAVAARFAEILRGSYWARNGDLHELVRRTEAVAEDRGSEPRVEELVGLIRRAAELGGDGSRTPRRDDE